MKHNAMGMDPCDNQNDAIFNTTTDKRTHVEARTGLFEVYVPLPSVTGNAGYGPVVDMGLYYSPVVNNHAALGDGWSFAFTTWYEKNNDLTLHSGEALKVEKGNALETTAVKVTWSDSDTTLTVERTDGRVETLKRAGNGKVWVPEKLTSDGYRYLNLTWSTVEQKVGSDTHHQVRLIGIADPDRTLVALTYGPDEKDPLRVKITFWPETNETLCFTLAIEDLALQWVKTPERTKTEFTYNDDGYCGWLLTSVRTFEGLTEQVEYDRHGLTFQDNPKLSVLPAVSRHTVTPLGGSAPVVDQYKYFWQTDTLRTDTGYENDDEGYQTEITRGERKTILHYRKDHELGSERVLQGSHKTCKDFESKPIEDTFVKTLQTRYDDDISKFSSSCFTTRGLETQFSTGAFSHFEYDLRSADAIAWLSPTLEEPARSVTSLDCQESEAFGDAQVRLEVSGAFLGTMAQTIPQESGGINQKVQLWQFANPSIYKMYSYISIPGFNRRRPRFILQAIDLKDQNDRNDTSEPVLMGQEVDYFEDDDFRKGRQKALRQGNADTKATLLTSTGTALSFAYALNADKTELTTTTTETRAGDARTSSETLSVLSGRLISQTDVDGNRTLHTYDEFGRLATRIACAQSETYKETTTYTYPDVGRIEITEQNGRKSAIDSDGRDNTIRQQNWDFVSETWRDTLQVDYNEQGQRQASTQYDYLPDGKKIVERCDFGYDDWGNECSQSFSECYTVFNRYDPSKLTREEWTGAATDKHRKCTTYNVDDTIKEITSLDVNGHPYESQIFAYTKIGNVEEARFEGPHGLRDVIYNYDCTGRRAIEEIYRDDDLYFEYDYAYSKDWLINEAFGMDLLYSEPSRPITGTLGKRTIDAWGRITASTQAGIDETYTYTGARSVPDTRRTGDGTTLCYDYISELGHRVSKVSRKSGKESKSFTYAYPANPRSTASEGDSELAFDHQLDDRVAKARTRVRQGLGKTVERNYTPGGRLLSETDATGKTVSYDYDNKGRRTRTVADTLTTDHSYDDLGQLAREVITLGSDTVTVTYTHDTLGREIRRRFERAGQLDVTLERDYYADGRLKSAELKEGASSRGKRSYVYTARGELASCETTDAWRPTNPKGKPIDKQVFSYDALGNVTTIVSTFEGGTCTSTHGYDKEHGFRLANVKHSHADYPRTTDPTYDANGRMTKDASGKTYGYDWCGRLIQAGSRYYTYDAMDHLISTGKGDQEHQIVYDGLQVRGEYRPNGDGRHLEAGSAACTVQRVKRAGVARTLFELRDAEGTVLVTYDATAKTTKHHVYSAYGEHQSDETDSLLGFNGQYRDSDNDQYPLGQGYRSYDPAHMQFNGPDSWSPFGSGGPQIYGYCAGDPVNRQDPTGHVGSGAVNRGLREIWGDSLPGPLDMGEDGPLIAAIIWGGVGILTAIATGGASLLVTAALVSLAVVSAATAITSVVIADTNPELAAILGWVSLGTAVAGGLTSLAKKAGQLVMKLGRSGMNVARKVSHKAAAAASRLRAGGSRALSRGGSPAARANTTPSDIVDDALGSLQPRGARTLSSFEEGYVGVFDVRTSSSVQQGPVMRLLEKMHDSLNIGDINTVGCTVTGVLGNGGYFDGDDATITAGVNSFAALQWGSFNLGRYHFK